MGSILIDVLYINSAIAERKESTMSVTAQSPIMGTISGFVFISQSGDRREFADANTMLEVVRARDDWEGDYFTVIRHDDDGQTEDTSGVQQSGNAKVGDRYVKIFCRCGASEWFRDRPEMPASARQYDCMNHDVLNGEDLEDIIENFNSSREPEY